MSYILDALRKADAERERGTVPGIHAQPVFAGAAPTRTLRSGGPAWAWIVAAPAVVLALAVIGLVWTLWGNGAPRATTDAVAAARPIAAPAPLPAPMPMAASAAVAPPAIVATAAPQQPPKTELAPITPARKPKPAVAPAVAQKAASAPAAADNRVYELNELPDDIRRQLPAFTVGGSMYSATPADRIVIINGQVLHEGDRITPELVLQQIKLKAAVLAFKGYRYGIAF